MASESLTESSVVRFLDVLWCKYKTNNLVFGMVRRVIHDQKSRLV